MSPTSVSRNPYELVTDNGQVINVQEAHPNQTIVIHGHRIKVKQIPITAALLDCAHYVRGIAFSEGDIVHCEEHDDPNHESRVVQARH